MQPWAEKGSSNSSSSSSSSRHRTVQSSLHYDQPLDTIQREKRMASSSHGFRTMKAREPMHDHHETEVQVQPDRVESLPLDGTQVLSFLNSRAYTDEIHGEDLQPNSPSYASYRQQIDRQSAASQFWKEWMIAVDTVDYLNQGSYIDAIYGLPEWVQKAIHTVREGTDKTQAIERLDMIRQHFLQEAQGDKHLAAQKAMTHNDWSLNFFESL